MKKNNDDSKYISMFELIAKISEYKKMNKLKASDKNNDKACMAIIGMTLDEAIKVIR